MAEIEQREIWFHMFSLDNFFLINENNITCNNYCHNTSIKEIQTITCYWYPSYNKTQTQHLICTLKKKFCGTKPCLIYD